jgi:hypothetical protein
MDIYLVKVRFKLLCLNSMHVPSFNLRASHGSVTFVSSMNCIQPTKVLSLQVTFYYYYGRVQWSLFSNQLRKVMVEQRK